MLSDNVKARTMDCRGIYRKKGERRAGRRLSERADEESRPSSRITCILRSSCNADSADLAGLDNPADHAKLKRDFGREKGGRKKAFAGSANILRRLFRK